MPIMADPPVHLDADAVLRQRCQSSMVVQNPELNTGDPTNDIEREGMHAANGVLEHPAVEGDVTEHGLIVAAARARSQARASILWAVGGSSNAQDDRVHGIGQRSLDRGVDEADGG